MGNILSYLKWRGDLTFQEREFCEVDNLVLSELSYLELSGIVPGPKEEGEITIEDMTEKYCYEEHGTACPDGPPPEFLPVLANSNRYRKVALSKYIEIFDEDSQIDFSAMHINLGDGTVYVVFRGTSDWLVGWREDFSMSFQPMPSHRLAAEYLETTISSGADVKYRVGGHSKGGNLAIYASMVCPVDKREQIIQIYSNDGPGLCEELFDMEKYQLIQPRLIRIVPEFSVVGSLFEHEAPTRIVASSGNGVFQHESMTWQVEGDHFVTCERRSEKCEFYNRLFDQWIESASLEQRKAFTKDFFDALEASGAKKGSELTQRGFEGFEAILLSVVQSERKTKIVIGKFIRSFFKVFRSVQFGKLVREKEMLQGSTLFLIGLFLMVVPEFAAQCAGFAIGGIAVAWLGKKQLDCAFSEDGTVGRRKQRMVLQMLLMCGVVFLTAQESVLLRFSGFLSGGLFLFLAYKWAKAAFERKMGSGMRICHMSLAVVSFLLGVVPIVTSGLALWHYVFAVGSFALLYGTGRILHAMYQNGKQNM